MSLEGICHLHLSVLKTKRRTGDWLTYMATWARHQPLPLYCLAYALVLGWVWRTAPKQRVLFTLYSATSYSRVCSLLRAGFSLDLYFDLEHEGDIFFQNVSWPQRVISGKMKLKLFKFHHANLAVCNLSKTSSGYFMSSVCNIRKEKLGVWQHL
jgi:hypothetical protein